MFLKAFLVFTSLVLYTSSRAIHKEKCMPQTEQLQNILRSSQNVCSEVFIPKINFTYIDNLYEGYQAKFCEVSEVLNKSQCTDSSIKQLQRLSDQIKGNVTCKFQANGTSFRISKFWSELKSYVTSLSLHCPKN